MVRSIIIFVLALFIGIVVQGVVVHGLYPAAIAPDFFLILVVALALFHRSPLGLLGAFALGLISDLASARFLGPNAAGAVIAFGLVVLLSHKVYAEKAIAVMILSFLCCVAKTFSYAAFLALYVDQNVLDATGLRLMFWEAGLTALVAPVVIRLLGLRQGESLFGRVVGRESFRWT